MSSFNAVLYAKILDGFNVAANSKYKPIPKPEGGYTTFCNSFAIDVMNSAEFTSAQPTAFTPQFTSDSSYITCKTLLSRLKGGTHYPHWQEVTWSVAQSRADQGYPTIGITSTHIACVHPNTGNTSVNSAGEVRITQAGILRLNYSTISAGFFTPSAVKFFSYYV
jgi:hypothetical protein